MGVGVPGGVELAVTAIKASLEANPDWVYISADAKNAFNSFNRDAIWKEVSAGGNFPNIPHHPLPLWLTITPDPLRHQHKKARVC